MQGAIVEAGSSRKNQLCFSYFYKAVIALILNKLIAIWFFYLRAFVVKICLVTE